MSSEFVRLTRIQMADNDVSQGRLGNLTNLGPVTVNRIVNSARDPTEVQALRIVLGLLLPPERRALANDMLEGAGFDALTVPEEALPAA